MSATEVTVVDSDEKRERFRNWVLAYADRLVVVDTETTGLNVYAADWRLRMVQLGTAKRVWVVPMEGEQGEANLAYVQFAMLALRRQAAHNRTYDASALDRAGIRHRLWEATADDTFLMAHLVDSRERVQGGSGHKLEELGKRYIRDDADKADLAFRAWAKANKVKLDERYAAAPIDLPEFVDYAAADVVIGAELAEVLPKLMGHTGDLYEFEKEFQRVCAGMAARGMLVDVDYAAGLDEELEAEAMAAVGELERWGIVNVNSTKQVRQALVDAGVSAGKSVDKNALALIDHPIAAHVLAYRHANKFRASYVAGVLDKLDENNRVHADIRSLAARTARMSVSNPPLQQLPAGDWRIRRMFVASPGKVIAAVDFSQIELRVLAALSNERKMLEAFEAGEDLHSVTAELLGVERKVGKAANFLTVYGGGAAKLAEQAGISFEEARSALRRFRRVYPAVDRYGRKLQERCDFGKRALVTPAGRHLRLDKDRTYAATNYVVQSTARDILAECALDLDEAGLTDGLLMMVHDEFIFEFDEEEAEAMVGKVLGKLVRGFGAVRLDADGSVYGPSWGHGYGAKV